MHHLPAGLLLCSLAACAKGPGQSDSGANSDELAADCKIDIDAISDLALEETDNPLVLRASWSTSDAQRSQLRVQEEGGEQWATPLEPAASTTHEILVRGLHVGADVSVRPEVPLNGGSLCGDLASATTGALPAALPTLTFEAGEGVQTDGYIFMPLITTDGVWITAFDGDGEVVWAQLVELDVWRVRLDPDGSGLLVNYQAPSPTQDGGVVHISWDSVQEERVAYPGLHTDFVVLDDGTITGLTSEIRTFEFEGVERNLIGDQVVEFSLSGGSKVLWSSFDELPVDLTREWPEPNSDWGTEYEDWSHVNGISYDEDSREYFVSAGGVNALTAFSRDTGEVPWVMSNLFGSVRPEGPGSQVEAPHSVNPYNDGIVVFMRNDYSKSACSSVNVYTFDFPNKRANLESAYETPDCLSVYYLGEARPIGPDGAIQVIWTTGGRAEQLDPDGISAWTMQASLGAGIGFSEFSESMYW